MGTSPLGAAGLAIPGVTPIVKREAEAEAEAEPRDPKALFHAGLAPYAAVGAAPLAVGAAVAAPRCAAKVDRVCRKVPVQTPRVQVNKRCSSVPSTQCVDTLRPVTETAGTQGTVQQGCQAGSIRGAQTGVQQGRQTGRFRRAKGSVQQGRPSGPIRGPQRAVLQGGQAGAIRGSKASLPQGPTTALPPSPTQGRQEGLPQLWSHQLRPPQPNSLNTIVALG